MHQNKANPRSMDMKAGNQLMFIEVKTPKGLLRKIMLRVKKEELRSERRSAFAALAGTFVSAGLFVAASAWFYSGLVHSGFTASFSLLFSDSQTVLLYWRDFVAMLVSALPIISLAACLCTIGIVIVSLRSVFRHKRGLWIYSRTA